MTGDRCWRCLGDVDIAPLLAWMAEVGVSWPQLSDPTKPQRVRGLPTAAYLPAVSRVLAVLEDELRVAGLDARDVLLARVRPGVFHPMHVDGQSHDHLTRVHVPLVTNSGAWHEWEEEPGRVHFEAGKAYAFDTTRRHAFGNDGETGRVHLAFDVHLSDALLRRRQEGNL